MSKATETELIKRLQDYIKSGDQMLFSWWHLPTQETRSVAVICNPLGTEYVSGYRSIRHLADRLAGNGVLTLRFDYAFTGESTGGDFSEAGVHGFIEDTKAAVLAASAKAPHARVFVLGIGLGATFAALASESLELKGLVLWNPTISGRKFIREQKLLSELLNKETGDQSTDIDSAGVYLTESQQQEFRTLNLLKAELPKVESLLVVSRSDMDQDGPLVSELA